MRHGNAVKLGFDIGAVAALRGLRNSPEPDLVSAASAARQAGADMIIHVLGGAGLAEDGEIKKICRTRGETQLKVSSGVESVRRALRLRPSLVCLIEGSLKGSLPRPVRIGASSERRLKRLVGMIKRSGAEAAVLIEPEAAGVRKAKAAGADIVELCASGYAGSSGSRILGERIEALELAARLAAEMGLRVHAGCELDYGNAGRVADIPCLEFLNAGHAIAARSVFVGLKTAVLEMKRLVG